MADRGYGRVVNVSSGAGQLVEDVDLCAGVLDVEVGAERVHANSCGDLSRLRRARERRRSGMGANRHGRPIRAAIRSAGADTTVWLATLPDNGPTGGFFRDRQPIDW